MADTTSPTITLSADLVALKPGQAAIITFTLSEPSTDFAASDISVSGGTLSNFKGSGTTYTALYTPTINSETSTRISVADGVFSDAAGNKNADGADANNKISFLLERTFVLAEGTEIKGKLPPGTQALSGWKVSFLDETGSIIGSRDESPMYNLSPDGSFSYTRFDFNGLHFGPTTEGTVTFKVTATPDAPIIVQGERGIYLGDPEGDRGDARRVVELSDKSLYLVGYDRTGGPEALAMTKLRADGVVDRTFGVQGYVSLPSMSLFDATLQKDDKLLVAGYDPGDRFRALLIRVNKDGTADKTFSEDGRVNVPWGDRPDGTWLHAVEVQADGKIVVAGRASVLSSGSTTSYQLDFGVARFNPDGTLDTSFNGKGWTTIQLGGSDIARGVAIQPNGKLIIGGYTTVYGSTDFAAVRLNADGSVDKDFGQSGIAILSLPDRNESAFGGVTLLKSGKFLLVGASQILNAQGISEGVGLVARFNVDGSLDTGFGVNGLTKIDFPSLTGPIDILAYDVTERSDGRLTFTGNVLVEGIPVHAFAAQLLPEGKLDPSFGQGGTLLTGLGQSIGSVLTSDGGFIFGGSTRGPEWEVIVPAKLKVLPNGQPDPSFNPYPAFKPGGPAVVLNHLVSIYDPDSNGDLVGPTASYKGTRVTIQREGTASSDDRFGSLGLLTFVDSTAGPVDAGSVQISGVVIGSYEQAAGKLSITFNEAATQSKVDEALSSLTYSNAGTTAPAQLKLLVTVNDGVLADSATLTLVNAAAAQPGKGLGGVAYHWKSHALLSGVTVSTGDQKAVQADSDLFDLRGASFDAASGTLTVQLWVNPVQASMSFDVSAVTQGAKSASFTPSLSASTWTVLANTDKPNDVAISGFLSNPSAAGVTGALQLGTLTMVLTPNAPVAVSFKNLSVGNSTSADVNLTLASASTDASGAFALALPDGSYGLTVSRAVGDGSNNNGVTSADALAALKIAVGMNPNTDPDGSGPLQTPMLSPYQVMAADVNGDGRVTSADALAILKMSVKLADAPAPAWMFVEEDRDFWDEATKAFTLTRSNAAWDAQIKVSLPADAKTNLVGVLKGDVNGSWTLAGASTLEATNPTYFKDLAQLIGVPADQWGIPPGG
jgi:uncharacterized delta-60 repeat protein